MSNSIRRVSNSQSKSKHGKQRTTYMPYMICSLFLSMLVRLEQSPSSNPVRLWGGLVGREPRLSHLDYLCWIPCVPNGPTMRLIVLPFISGSSVFGFQKMSTIPSIASHFPGSLASEAGDPSDLTCHETNRVKHWHVFWPKIIGVIAFLPTCDFSFFQTFVGQHGSVNPASYGGSRDIGREHRGTHGIRGSGGNLGHQLDFFHMEPVNHLKRDAPLNYIRLICGHPCTAPKSCAMQKHNEEHVIGKSSLSKLVS